MIYYGILHMKGNRTGAMVEKRLKRNYKDSMFRVLFNDEEKIRELYNALEDTDYGLIKV